MYSLQTHVNGMLQESDMPSSASALYRNVRQKCVQMQIDKTNVSAAKRYKEISDYLFILTKTTKFCYKPAFFMPSLLNCWTKTY